MPTASAIVEASLAAQGGRAALEALPAVVREGEITIVVDGRPWSGSYRTCVDYPESGLVEIDAGPVQILEGVAHGHPFVCDRATRQCGPTDPEHAEELRATAREANRELLFEQATWSRGTVERRGDTWVIQHRDAGRPEVVYTFSRGTELPVAKRIGERERRYADWREIDGLRFPFLIEDYEGGQLLLRIRLRQVRVVANLDQAWCSADLGRAEVE